MDLTPGLRAAIARRLDFVSAPFIVLSVVSLTTVGYGDVYPETAGGKAFASVVLLLSLGIVAAPAGIIAADLSAQRSEGQEP